jgi:ABC-type dipeptide/oligopeptide/nickel transport system permease component
MLTYLARRLALSVVVLCGLLVATFVIVHLVPGDPVEQLLGSRATPQAIASARHQVGLDQPLLQQFFSFAGGALHGDFGRSIPLNAPVSQVIGPRLLPSALLIAYGLGLALLIGVPLAVVAAVRPNRGADNLIRFATTFAFAMPTFWLGLMLALLLGLELGWFPVSGYDRSVSGSLRTLTLPALTIGLSLAVVVVRTLRSSLLEVLQSEYVEAARSRGLSEVRIVGKHAMRNAVTGTITILSVNVGFLIGGTVVIEAVYQIPGAGSLLVQAVQRRDYELIQVLALLAGTAVVVVGLLADLLQAVLDPRVRLSR